MTIDVEEIKQEINMLEREDVVELEGYCKDLLDAKELDG